MVDLLLFLTAMVGRLCAVSRLDQLASGVASNTTYDNVTHLINTMLKSYDIRLRPNFGEKALILDLEIAIASFDSVSEVNMDFTLTLYLYQYWRDERLAWLPNQRNESITVSGDFSQRIWVPDTFLANDKSSYLHDVTEKNKMLKLYSDGYIAYGMRFTSTLACKMDLRSFPLDRQNFSVEIESYGYTTSDLFMRWRNGRKSIRGVMESEITQFRILDYEAHDRVETTTTGDYQRLSLVINLRRSVGYYIFQTYLPSTLIVALSWISFWINHEATAARVALGVTTVLTMTTISASARSTLPRISYIKAIDVYLVMCFVFVFAALLEYAAVNYTYWGSRMNKGARRRQSDTTPDPVFATERKMTKLAAKEFPTWDMYVQKEDEPSGSELRTRRPKSNPHDGKIDKGMVQENIRKRQSVYEEEEDEDDVLISDLADQGTSEDGVSLAPDPRNSPTGRLSPIPGLLQQLRKQAPAREKEGHWSSSPGGGMDIGSRPASPPVVLHTAGTVRRRQQCPLAPATSSASCDQQLLDYNLGDRSHRTRRRTHSAQTHARRTVSFTAWRPRATAPSLYPASRLQSRQLSRRELVSSLRQKAKAVRAVLPRIHDVNIIDKWSRAMFPFSFVLFNFIYWCYYLFRDWND